MRKRSVAAARMASGGLVLAGAFRAKQIGSKAETERQHPPGELLDLREAELLVT